MIPILSSKAVLILRVIFRSTIVRMVDPYFLQRMLIFERTLSYCSRLMLVRIQETQAMVGRMVGSRGGKGLKAVA